LKVYSWPGAYLRRSDLGFSPVEFDELLSHECRLPGTLAVRAATEAPTTTTTTATRGAAADALGTLVHETFVDAFFLTLLTPQQIVLGQQAPVLTGLRRTTQVKRAQVRQHVQRKLEQTKGSNLSVLS